MRDEDAVLRSCPTCQGEIDLDKFALRDFRNIDGSLPGRIGGTDVDYFLEQARTGRALALEFKPNKYVPTGQRLTLRWFKRAGADVWLVNDKHFPDGYVEVSEFKADGTNGDWLKFTISEFEESVASWWEAA